MLLVKQLPVVGPSFKPKHVSRVRMVPCSASMSWPGDRHMHFPLVFLLYVYSHYIAIIQHLPLFLLNKGKHFTVENCFPNHGYIKGF